MTALVARRFVGAFALVAAFVVVPASPAATSQSTCDEAMRLVRVPKLIEVRCVAVAWPYGEGWTTDGQDLSTYRVGQCVCGEGWADHVEVYTGGRRANDVAFTIGHELGHAYAAVADGPWQSEAYADHWARCVTTRTASCT